MSNTYITETALLKYVNAATDLAESIKRNIMHSKNGVAVIDDRTVLLLNKFMIASNAIADLPELLEEATKKFN